MPRSDCEEVVTTPRPCPPLRLPPTSCERQPLPGPDMFVSVRTQLGHVGSVRAHVNCVTLTLSMCRWNCDVLGSIAWQQFEYYKNDIFRLSQQNINLVTIIWDFLLSL